MASGGRESVVGQQVACDEGARLPEPGQAVDRNTSLCCGSSVEEALDNVGAWAGAALVLERNIVKINALSLEVLGIICFLCVEPDNVCNPELPKSGKVLFRPPSMGGIGVRVWAGQGDKFRGDDGDVEVIEAVVHFKPSGTQPFRVAEAPPDCLQHAPDAVQHRELVHVVGFVRGVSKRPDWEAFDGQEPPQSIVDVHALSKHEVAAEQEDCVGYVFRITGRVEDDGTVRLANPRVGEFFGHIIAEADHLGKGNRSKVICQWLVILLTREKLPSDPGEKKGPGVRGSEPGHPVKCKGLCTSHIRGRMRTRRRLKSSEACTHGAMRDYSPQEPMLGCSDWRINAVNNHRRSRNA